LEEMNNRGLDDLVILVINDHDEADYVSLMDEYDYRLPVLQDTEEAGVFEAWNAGSYDLFIIDRNGFVDYAESRSYPEDDYEHLVDVLSLYI